MTLNLLPSHSSEVVNVAETLSGLDARLWMVRTAFGSEFSDGPCGVQVTQRCVGGENLTSFSYDSFFSLFSRKVLSP